MYIGTSNKRIQSKRPMTGPLLCWQAAKGGRCYGCADASWWSPLVCLCWFRAGKSKGEKACVGFMELLIPMLNLNLGIWIYLNQESQEAVTWLLWLTLCIENETSRFQLTWWSPFQRSFQSLVSFHGTRLVFTTKLGTNRSVWWR